MSRVLAVTSEIYPLIKTGGLADVTGALPLALGAAGVETTTPRPRLSGRAARADRTAARCGISPTCSAATPTSSGEPPPRSTCWCSTRRICSRGRAIPTTRPDGREWHDNGIRFAALGAAGAAIGAGLIPGLSFDIVHAHDWQAAMAPVYLNYHNGPRPGTVLTIHNLAFQGRFAASLFPRLGLPGSAFGFDGLEYHHDVSFLKGGLCFADRLTTVSPTYAREITTAGVRHGA